jgi:aspartate/glutamate racemase
VTAEAREHLLAAARWCMEQGAQVIVPACTEVSVGLTRESFPDVPLVDPLSVAAEALLDVAYGRREPGEFYSRD